MQVEIYKTSSNLNQLNSEELINLLRIYRTSNIGARTFYNLLKINSNLAELVELLPELIRRNKGEIKIASRQDVLVEIDKTLQYGASFVTYQDANFPRILRQIDDCPPVLTIKGNPELFNQDSIAIVGSRNCSHNAALIAQKWAKKLGEETVIVSGLARGVDRFAHLGSMESGTIAVIAGGIDVIYPQENKDIYNKIAKNGLVIAEMPFGMQPIAKHFPKRNRIISGLSLGVLVVEASLQSGSLITARFAAEQNRECFAIPGSPFDLRAKGTNKLIKEGAYLVESAEEILEILSQSLHRCVANEDSAVFVNSMPGLTVLPDEQETLKVKQQLLNLLNYTPVNIESLILMHNFDWQLLNIALIELEIAGEIERIANNCIIKKYKID
ncbi:DNA-processing protein DprA [Rickettsiales endosymbiont of Stachyamoeba lipophora]|uniref:DNA-processing protein DprA n=1 Tax=Rickettsiales endosymbiont of Stachyamoeba lipophora TaxID=2486578 RepID=UPI000F646786|nr:DNA-processing protein DprA [Rickettsiales endosymbiont of Stachyamoeba lipophora]AZL16035.1 DNA-protecting protein DprA [Rickettsiales endosymbiont of Stachyamoeba lipophora]